MTNIFDILAKGKNSNYLSTEPYALFESFNRYSSFIITIPQLQVGNKYEFS